MIRKRDFDIFMPESYGLIQGDTEAQGKGIGTSLKDCENFFGEPRKSTGSHRIYKTPWQGDPRINIQNDKGKTKTYQVKQVLLAIEKLEVDHGVKK